MDQLDALTALPRVRDAQDAGKELAKQNVDFIPISLYVSNFDTFSNYFFILTLKDLNIRILSFVKR